jgi:hypothetical protein
VEELTLSQLSMNKFVGLPLGWSGIFGLCDVQLADGGSDPNFPCGGVVGGVIRFNRCPVSVQPLLLASTTNHLNEYCSMLLFKNSPASKVVYCDPTGAYFGFKQWSGAGCFFRMMAHRVKVLYKLLRQKGCSKVDKKEMYIVSEIDTVKACIQDMLESYLVETVACNRVASYILGGGARCPTHIVRQHCGNRNRCEFVNTKPTQMSSIQANECHVLVYNIWERSW